MKNLILTLILITTTLIGYSQEKTKWDTIKLEPIDTTRLDDVEYLMVREIDSLSIVYKVRVDYIIRTTSGNERHTFIEYSNGDGDIFRKWIKTEKIIIRKKSLNYLAN